MPTADWDRTALFGLDTDPPGFDPHRWWNSATYCGTANVFEQLIGIDPDTAELRPQLATEVPRPTKAGTLYTFSLRRGVRFHHGRELTSADVKASLERLARPETQAETGALFASLPIRGMADLTNERTRLLDGIAAIDPYTFSIELEHPDRALLPHLTYPSAAILPRDAIETPPATVNWSPIGTGPYVLARAEPGIGAMLERNASYWGQPATIDSVRFEFNLPQTTSVERITKDEQDFMYEPLHAATVEELMNDPGLASQVISSDEDCCYFLTLPFESPSLSKPEVRKAIAMAIDKSKLVRAVGGLASEATGGIFSPLNKYFSPGLALSHDPKRSRQLLADAGHAAGLQLDLLSNNLFPEKEISAVIRDELAPIGVRVTIHERRYNEKAAESLEHPDWLTLCDWHLSVPHASYLVDSGFTRAALQRGCCNYSRWTHDHLEQLAVGGHQADNAADEIDIYRKIDRLVVSDESIWIPLIYSKRVDLVSRRVRRFSQPRYPSALIKYFALYGLG